MPVVNSIGAAMAYVAAAVQKSLAGEVLRAVKAEEANQIETVVYEAYSPRVYKRRGAMGSPSNIVGEVTGTTLNVYNVTPANTMEFVPEMGGWINGEEQSGKNLPMVVETGNGYDYYSPGARPFTRATTEALAASKAHVQALRSGLMAAGLKVK